MKQTYVLQIWTNYETWGDVIELPEEDWEAKAKTVMSTMPEDKFRVVLRIEFKTEILLI